MELLNIDKLHSWVKKRLVPYAQEFIRLNKDILLSLFIYGSATGKDFIVGISDINLLAIFEKVELDDLKRNLKLVFWGRKKNIAAPLILSRQHIETSKDTFPLEFLEIKERNLLLYGEDIFAEMEIDKSYLRLFCEEQLKGKLIRIRQAYLELGLKKKGIEAILKKSFNSLFPVFRSLLRIKDTAVPLSQEEVLSRLGDEFDIEAEVFLTLLKDKKNDEKIAGRDIEVYLRSYLSELEKLARIVDRL